MPHGFGLSDIPYGRLAQLVEQQTFNLRVVGSKPTAFTISIPVKRNFQIEFRLNGI